ncbi:hypothetical protein BFU36_09390 [Sulfolobus sp. A20]|uniref:hypothetical protein n=1 Tax=Sulfolobaceae TaxID=118883 RepID=UPI0008460146|nr:MULTISPECIES: hypothetical protein [unclassified Sulfolobus]TRM78722.1 hypothetical protein DJ532_00200 [Sulfolobus sp. A20-N-F8]TRM81696.1 hypothetical protein DJ524_03215 [Sulfolobus sp. D5]TRM95537.1 hypothetical protein DJ526_00145 [Sulfolobus sp. A20-N-G8]TRM98411.1 hypothetical protein DJ527_10670 [Sulfolobus sp. F1]AOL16885.1 hypothetical protein BFU36_09390 [Sulfolobus sp. A20]
MTTENNVTYTDLLDYQLLKHYYESVISRLKNKSIRNLKSTIKELLGVIGKIKNFITDSRLKDIILNQEKVAKRLLVIINIRYLIFFIYKYIIGKLISTLYDLLQMFISKLETIKY